MPVNDLPNNIQSTDFITDCLWEIDTANRRAIRWKYNKTACSSIARRDRYLKYVELLLRGMFNELTLLTDRFNRTEKKKRTELIKHINRRRKKIDDFSPYHQPHYNKLKKKGHASK